MSPRIATVKKNTRPNPPKKSNKPTHSTPTLPPIFNDPVSTPDPTKYKVPHASDTQAYNEMDALIKASKFLPLPFPVAPITEPVLTLAAALGPSGKTTVASIQAAGSIVFHSVGDTGATGGPKSENTTVDKMLTDFVNEPAASLPQFFYHLGDIVYSFGEHKYYYDQFYEAYRNYPRPIVAIPGNHDGIVLPPPAGSGNDADSLSAFIANFCTATPTHSADAVGISRTTMIQPGVYYTFDAPFVRFLGIYSNILENPGVISSTKDPTTGVPQFPQLSNAQLSYLTAALTRIKQQNYPGAVIIAVHHPPYAFGTHTGSMVMLKEIDAICKQTGVWPHAILSGHAHSYQRFTRGLNNRQIPFIVCGNGGHGLVPISNGTTIRTPVSMPIFAQPELNDTVTFENYDDKNYGYLRIIADPTQLRIEYHPASDGGTTKTPNDFVTVDLATSTLIHYIAASERKLKPTSKIRKALKR
jgi:Calcineurin-like phosphoesterase